MMPRRGRYPLAVGLLVAVACPWAQGRPLPGDKIPAFAIPRISKPPTLDGAIDPAEWREATAIGGVANQVDNFLVPRPTTFFLAWDAGHLYVACRTRLLPGYKPRVGGREAGAGGVGDDSMEFHFKPLGKNVPTGRTDSSYKFTINCLGFEGDLMRVAVGQQFRNWRPRFRTATRITPPGSAPAGGRWWEAEVAMSIEDFELAGPNRAGDAWKLMLGFNHIPCWTQARIPCNTSYFDPGGYCEGTLVENTPAVQVVMEDLPGPCDGVAVAAFRAYNPTAQPVTLDLLAHYTELREKTVENKPVTEEVDLLKKTHALTVEPGKTAEFSVREKLPRDLGPNAAFVTHRVAQGGRELFRYAAYFRLGYGEEWARHTPPKEAFPFSATFNPVRSNLLIEGDAYYIARPDDAKALHYRVLRDGATRPIAEGRIERSITYYFRDLVQLPPLDEGRYRVEASLVTADGAALGPETKPFEKLDEAKAFAEWWEKGLGDPERVIPPFEPMEKAWDKVSVWGRTYRLDALGLPSGIVSQGGEVLAAPARVVVVVDGKEEAISLRGRPRFTEVKEWRVSFTGKARGSALELTSRGTVEQDGLVYLELTYAPRRGRATLDALRIEFPVAAEHAECLLCLGTGGNFSARTTLLVPEKEGRVWSTLDTGRNGSAMTVGSFYPCVWLGNERRGLLWWGDSDRGWVPDDDVPAHDVVRRGDEIVLRNHLIGKPVALEGPRTVAFSYMASPFRPLVKNWRMVVHSSDGTFSGGESWGFKWRKDPKTGKPFDGWNLLTPPSADPAEWSTIWAEYKKKSDEKVRRERPFDPSRARNWMFAHTSLPLVGYGWKSPDDRVTGYFAPAEWGHAECYTPSNIDYYLYLADRAFREGGLKTIYWDIFFPILHHSIQNEVAYVLPDGGSPPGGGQPGSLPVAGKLHPLAASGRIQPGYTGFNTRRFMRRMYALMTDHGLTPGGQVSHATNDYLLVACPWMDAILDGEYHQLTDQSQMDWVDGYPVERMRVLSCPHNWGTAISWMNLIQVTDKDRAARIHRGIRDYLRLFDSWRGPVDTLTEPILDWGICDERTEYVPLWRNPYATCEDTAILVSMWRLPDRVLLAVFNNDGKQGRDAVLAIDLEKLGLVPKLPWQEFIRVADVDKVEGEPAAQLDFYARTLKVPALAPHTGRLISIRKF